MSIFWSARMLAEAAPDARVIVLLRDPVDRYVSDRTLTSGFVSGRWVGVSRRRASSARR